MQFSKEKLEEAKKIIGQNAAELIAKELQIEDWNEEKLLGKSIFKKENTASMKWFNDANLFKCFSTGKTYDIVDHYMQHHNLTFLDTVNKVFALANQVDTEFHFEKVQKTPDTNKSREKYLLNYKYPYDESENNRYVVEQYLQRRGVSVSTMDFCNVKQDDNGNIAFQFLDTDGLHLATKYRLSRPQREKEMKWWWQNKDKDGNPVSNCPLLYGANRVDITKPLVVVEGLVDRLSCVEAGFTNSVSIPGGAQSTDWIDFNWDILDKVPEIIIFSDDDEPGQKMARDTVKRLGEAKCRIVKAEPEIKKQISEFFNGKVDKVDANSVLMACGQSTLYRLINDAEYVPNERLTYLMDIEDEDIMDIEKFSTGYKVLDKILYGSLMGTFTILTGKSGGGKSTIANQLCVLSPLEQGYKTMIYSGELSSPQLKNWIIKPFAGLNHSFGWQKENMPMAFAVTKEAKKAISSFYKNNIILYNDEDNLSAAGTDILSQMEYAYKRFGCKVFLIDNLMTVSTDNDDEDLWKSQKEFVKKLLKFTNKYKVNVTLVAHPKKPSKGEEPGVYSVHGASELVNLCHRLLWVDRLEKDPEGFDANIKIIKDRTTGQAGRECKLYYDKRTMRLYSDDEERHYVYEWETVSKITYPNDFQKRLAINIKDQSAEIFGAVLE